MSLIASIKSLILLAWRRGRDYPASVFRVRLPAAILPILPCREAPNYVLLISGWTNECRRRGGPRHTARRATKQLRSAFFVFYRFWFLLHRWQKKFPTPVDRHIGMRVRMQRRALDTTQHTLAGNRHRNSTGAKIRERRQSRQRWSAPADRARFARNTGILFRRGTGGQQTPQKRRPASRRLFLRQRASPFHKPWAKSVTARRAAL